MDGILDNIFQILDTENVPVMQIIPCLAILLKKSESDIVNIAKKTHTKNYLKKTQMTLKNYIQVPQKKEKKKGLLGMWVFSAKIYNPGHNILTLFNNLADVLIPTSKKILDI